LRHDFNIDLPERACRPAKYLGTRDMHRDRKDELQPATAVGSGRRRELKVIVSGAREMLRRLHIKAACCDDFRSAYGLWLAAVNATDSNY